MPWPPGTESEREAFNTLGCALLELCAQIFFSIAEGISL
jgi:hypothetical protein